LKQQRQNRFRHDFQGIAYNTRHPHPLSLIIRMCDQHASDQTKGREVRTPDRNVEAGAHADEQGSGFRDSNALSRIHGFPGNAANPTYGHKAEDSGKDRGPQEERRSGRSNVGGVRNVRTHRAGHVTVEGNKMIVQGSVDEVLIYERCSLSTEIKELELTQEYLRVEKLDR
jgi:hypothetical protein